MQQNDSLADGAGKFGHPPALSAHRRACKSAPPAPTVQLKPPPVAPLNAAGDDSPAVTGAANGAASSSTAAEAGAAAGTGAASQVAATATSKSRAAAVMENGARLRTTARATTPLEDRADELIKELIMTVEDMLSHRIIPVCVGKSTSTSERQCCDRMMRAAADLRTEFVHFSLRGASPGTQTHHTTLVVLYELVS